MSYILEIYIVEYNVLLYSYVCILLHYPDVVLQVTALNDQTALADGSLHLNCSVTVNYTVNSVDFTWEADGDELSRDTINNADSGTFTHLYNTTSLTQADDNTEYTCRVVINGNQSLTEFDTYQLTLSESEPVVNKLASLHIIITTLYSTV